MVGSVGRSAIPNGWDSPAFCLNPLAASTGDLAVFPLTTSSIFAIKRKFDRNTLKTDLQKAILECLSDSVPFAFEKVPKKPSQDLDIGTEHHVQLFSALHHLPHSCL